MCLCACVCVGACACACVIASDIDQSKSFSITLDPRGPLVTRGLRSLEVASNHIQLIPVSFSSIRLFVSVYLCLSASVYPAPSISLSVCRVHWYYSPPFSLSVCLSSSSFLSYPRSISLTISISLGLCLIVSLNPRSCSFSVLLHLCGLSPFIYSLLSLTLSLHTSLCLPVSFTVSQHFFRLFVSVSLLSVRLSIFVYTCLLVPACLLSFLTAFMSL